VVVNYSSSNEGADRVVTEIVGNGGKAIAVHANGSEETDVLETLNVTPFGAFHTVIGLIAVFAGLTALVRYAEISPKSLAGKIYIAATVLTCLTGFGIFHHGGFGKAPGLQATAGALFLVFLVGAVLQVRRLRATDRQHHKAGSEHMAVS
jgi:hypothetical protein